MGNLGRQDKGKVTSALSLLLASMAFGCAAADESELDLGASEAALSASDVKEVLSDVMHGLYVKVEQGRLHGKLVGETREFLGIPYAKAPVGELRFAPPHRASHWKGTREAVSFGPACPQPPGALAAPGPQSEDCLTLNVYAPKAHKRDQLPVMVFIHGGAFVSGASSQYDGQKLSEKGDVIVVTLNYRLGALGLLALPALDAEREQPSGNDAFRDQRLALKWVKQNIDAFGGDPDNVTLFGESAGSMSTCLHMVSPRSKKLADRFIMESASCVGGLPILKKEQAQAVGAGLAATFCSGAEDVVACLREQPAADLVKWGASSGISGAGWGPVVNADDPFLPAHPAALIKSGQYNKGPVIIGTNVREWGLFQQLGPTISPNPTTIAQLNAVIDAQFGPAAPYVKAQYSAPVDQLASLTYTRLMTDYVFRCPARTLARLTTEQGSTAYLYSFEYGYAFHAFELPYVFGNPSLNLGAPVLVPALRDAMQTYWTSFAHGGDPNSWGQAAWPQYDAATDRHMTLNTASAASQNLAKSDCDFWARILPPPG